MEGKKICCICKEEFEGWGNNPQPVKSEGVCCNSCNMQYVITARVFGLSAITLPQDKE